MSRTAAPMAIRGSDFRLRRAAGAAHEWLVEELGQDRVANATGFAAADVGAAADLLDRSYLARLSAGKSAGKSAGESAGESKRDAARALQTALRWGLAHRGGAVDEIRAMMAEGSSLVDHRHLGLGEVPKEQLLGLLGAGWESNRVALVAEYERWSAGAVLARVVYVGHGDMGPIEDSVSYTVFDVDGAGRISRMDVYDGDSAGRAAADLRYDEISGSAS